MAQEFWKQNCIMTFLVREIDTLDEWFISTDSINWYPKEWYKYTNHWGKVSCRNYTDAYHWQIEYWQWYAYHTEEECKEAHERKLAEVRLRKTSTFLSQTLEGKNGGWVVGQAIITLKSWFAWCC